MNPKTSIKLRKHDIQETFTTANWGKTPSVLLAILSYKDKHHLFLARTAKYSVTNFLQYNMELSYKKNDIRTPHEMRD